MSRPVNQKQIAALAGVSQTVVSRVLSGRAREIGIADETIRRVSDIAERFNYLPNIGASLLQGRKTHLLSVIVRALDDPVLIALLAQARHAASQAGYSTIIAGFDHGHYNAKDVEMMEAYRPDAYLLLGDMDFSRWPLHFLSAGKPIVNITESARENPAPVQSVSADEACGCRMLLEHLKQAGHSRIGLIADGNPVGRQRLSSFLSEMAHLGLAAPAEWVFASDACPETAGAEAARHYAEAVRAGNAPTAFCAMNDTIALSALSEFLRCGLTVPGNLAIAGCNDIPAARMSYPSLTTLARPIAALVHEAMRRLTAGDAYPESACAAFRPELKVRESTAPRA